MRLLSALLEEEVCIEDLVLEEGSFLVHDFLVNFLLAVYVLDHLEGVRWPINHEAVSALTRVLEGHLLEVRFPLLPPSSLRPKDCLQVDSLLSVPFSYEVVDKKCVLNLPLKLLLTQAAYRVESLLLDSFQDLVLCLFVLADCLDDALRVGSTPRLKLLQRFQVELLAFDCFNYLVMEEGDFPFVGVELLREIFKVRLL